MSVARFRLAPVGETAVAERRSQPRGWWGVALFVATEATLLGCVFGSYFYLRFKAAAWPPEGTAEPKVLVPLILTAVLLTTSAPMLLASRAARRGRAAAALRLLLAALLVQSGYFAMQIQLFTDDLHRFTPQEHAYASIYYVLLGAGHAHVAVGLLIDLFLAVKLVGGLTRYRIVGLQVAAFYWHFVNVLTVFVFLTQISPRL